MQLYFFSYLLAFEMYSCNIWLSLELYLPLVKNMPNTTKPKLFSITIQLSAHSTALKRWVKNLIRNLTDPVFKPPRKTKIWALHHRVPDQQPPNSCSENLCWWCQLAWSSPACGSAQKAALLLPPSDRAKSILTLRSWGGRNACGRVCEEKNRVTALAEVKMMKAVFFAKPFIFLTGHAKISSANTSGWFPSF